MTRAAELVCSKSGLAGAVGDDCGGDNNSTTIECRAVTSARPIAPGNLRRSHCRRKMVGIGWDKIVSITTPRRWGE
jgi:hypothetical protein